MFTVAPHSRIIPNIPVSNHHKGIIMAFLKLTEQNVQGKTVLIRADMNVP
ncbi:phosphoglycerate kinase, partial [Neisseria sp. P0006.S006]